MPWNSLCVNYHFYTIFQECDYMSISFIDHEIIKAGTLCKLKNLKKKEKDGWVDFLIIKRNFHGGICSLRSKQ